MTAIELMPVADASPASAAGATTASYAYAPHPAYGGPDGLARLVDAAHAQGLGVILDVVYNHVGPGSEALAAFGPYFTDRHETFWGDAIDYSQARGARVGDPERGACGCATTGSTGCASTRCTRSYDDERPRTSSPSSPSGSRGSTRARS